MCLPHTMSVAIVVFDFSLSLPPIYDSLCTSQYTGQNILGFLTGLCAIAGGVCAISRLMLAFYSGYKAGKAD